MLARSISFTVLRPVRMTMVIIELPLAPWRLRLRPSPQLSNGVVLVVFSDMLHQDSVSKFQVGWRQYGNISIVYTDNRLYLAKRYARQNLGREVVSNTFYQNSSCGLCCHPVLHFATNDIVALTRCGWITDNAAFCCSLC